MTEQKTGYSATDRRNVNKSRRDEISSDEVLHVKRLDKMKNEDIREDLKIRALIAISEKEKLKWTAHLLRMDGARQVETVNYLEQ